MSRSGAAISGGLLFGLTREEAARFAFLLSFPIILGAGLLKLMELNGAGVFFTSGIEIAVSAVFAFGTGILAIHYLIKYLKHNSLLIFVIYRIALAAFLLIYF